MEGDGRCKAVAGVREPCIELVRRGGERGRKDTEVPYSAFHVFPIGFVPHGSGGGTFVPRCGKVDEDGDVV